MSRNKFTATKRSHTILEWLMNGEGVTIQDIRDEFDLAYAQARADLILLEDIYGLETYRDGRQKVWTLTETEFDPSHVTAATAAALEFGAIALDLFKETPLKHEIDRIANYIEARVPERQQEHLSQFSDALKLRRTWLPAEREKITEHLEETIDAFFHADPLSIEYRRSDGDCRAYVVRPGKLVWYHGRLWLLATDLEETKLFDVAGIERSFRGIDEAIAENQLARLDLEDEMTVESLEDIEFGEDHDDIENFFDDAFGIYAANYPVEAVHLEVENHWATYLSRYRLHRTQKSEWDGDKLHVYYEEISICPEFKSFIMGMIPDVIIHDPPFLREEITDRITNWEADQKT